MYYDAVDANILHSTLWKYTADNTPEAGDGWNDEDLSIFSGGRERASGGWKRPYPMATAGTPLAFTWDRKKGEFRFRFAADPAIEAPTEVFLPEEFGPDPEISVSPVDPGRISREYRQEQQRLYIRHGGREGEIEVRVRISGSPKGGPGGPARTGTV